MYFEEKGEGFPLVLLHGNGEDHHYFDRQIDFFSRYYRVLAPDTPGHGPKEKEISPWNAFQEICIHSWKNKKFPGAICSVFLTEEILPFTSPCSFLPP